METVVRQRDGPRSGKPESRRTGEPKNWTAGDRERVQLENRTLAGLEIWRTREL